MRFLYSPDGEGELAIIKSVLQEAGIRFFVRGERIGTWMIGPPILHFNQKRIFVYPDDYVFARELIEDFQLKTGTRRRHSYGILHRLRMVVEFLLVLWFVPGGEKPPHINNST